MAGGDLQLDVRGIVPPVTSARLHLQLQDRLGRSRRSGVYRAKVLSCEPPIPGLEPGAPCCLKLTRSRRDEGPVVRGRALWQKLLRRAAAEALGSEKALADVYATVADPARGWFGTVEEWIGGRCWRLEIDERVTERPVPGPSPDYREPSAFRTEYAAKRFFMARLVRLFRELGADGLARRYAWRTGISQRRVVKRRDAGDDPYAGLTAVDFRDAEGDVALLRERVGAIPEELELPGPRACGCVCPSPRPLPGLPPAPTPRGSWRRLVHRLVWPFRLVFSRELRRAWLLDQVEDGFQAGMLTEGAAARIRAQADDPYVGVYLKCLAVHVCLLPTTPVVVALGGVWYTLARDLPFAKGAQAVALALAFFAVSPVSPGSLARGLYVVGVMIGRRELRRFRVALVLSFFRYVGYLGFPLQIVRTFPDLSMFMAARWATSAVHLIPLYGRRGNLLEHMVFDLFFNLPLTIARRR